MAEPVEDTHSVWNCRWSHLGYRLDGVSDDQQPETLWVCVRQPPARRSVTDEECTKCAFWEANGVPKTQMPRRQ